MIKLCFEQFFTLFTSILPHNWDMFDQTRINILNELMMHIESDILLDRFCYFLYNPNCQIKINTLTCLDFILKNGVCNKQTLFHVLEHVSQCLKSDDKDVSLSNNLFLERCLLLRINRKLNSKIFINFVFGIIM